MNLKVGQQRGRRIEEAVVPSDKERRIASDGVCQLTDIRFILDRAKGAELLCEFISQSRHLTATAADVFVSAGSGSVSAPSRAVRITRDLVIYFWRER
jgi:hypothetical protein